MVIENKDLTLIFRCKMRHSRKEDFKIIKCKMFDNYRLCSNTDSLYFESKILKEWTEVKQRFPTLHRIKIKYSSVGQNLLYLYDENNIDFLAIGYMTLIGVETND